MDDLTVIEDAGSASRRASADVMDEIALQRLEQVADVIAGRVDEIEMDNFVLAVEVFGPLMHADHLRLIRSAALAIQYYRKNPGGSEPAFYRKFAAVCGVDADDLKAYARVLQGEIRFRKRMGFSPLTDLPRLIDSDQPEDPRVLEALALRPATSFKHDPSEYVALAEQGLNNTEIAKHLGDVSEAGVRRGLAAAGYTRSRARIEETEA